MWSQYKKIVLIAVAVLFLVVLFFIKIVPGFKNNTIYQRENSGGGLSYADSTIEDLVIMDSDRDGIPDWEEGLWGTDPKNKQTNPGTPDGVTIASIKAEQRTVAADTTNPDSEKLTETDKFSRELFTTVAALNQNGNMDQQTVDALGASLAEKIQNSGPRKIYSLSEIKTTNNDTLPAFTSYKNTLTAIIESYKMDYTVLDVLEKFSKDENNPDASALSDLDPIIEKVNKMIGDMAKMTVPQSLSTLHLNVLNSLQRLVENTKDIQLYDVDAIVFYSAVSQYYPNINALELNVGILEKAMNQKVGN